MFLWDLLALLIHAPRKTDPAKEHEVHEVHRRHPPQQQSNFSLSVSPHLWVAAAVEAVLDVEDALERLSHVNLLAIVQVNAIHIPTPGGGGCAGTQKEGRESHGERRVLAV